LRAKDGYATWDGKDALGMALPAGVYLARADGAEGARMAAAALLIE
jgi:hypothetical protein